MNKKNIILVILLANSLTIKPYFFGEFCNYMKICRSFVGSFFVVKHRYSFLAQPNSIIQKNKTNSEVITFDQSFNHLTEKELVSCIKKSKALEACLAYDKLYNSMEFSPCGKASKLGVKKGFDASVVATFDASRPLYASGEYRPSAEPYSGL